MDYPGKVITKNQVTPTQTSASGVWTLDDAASAVKNNNWPVAGVPNPISKSLRFNSADTPYLNRTPGSAGNRQKFTISVWYKPCGISTSAVNANIINAGGDGSSLLIAGTGAFGATYDNCMLFREAGTTLFYWPMVFRDPSAWYHIVFAMDTTQATANNRAKLYVNGVDQGAFSGTAITQNTNTSINNTSAHYIGTFNGTNYPNNLYYTEYYLIDGQALTPSSFGMTDPQTGVWEPIRYTGTYGTNGFYLNFKDATSTTTLGYDYSGNSNNWTTNNFSVTAGTGNDSLTDVPTPWIAYNTTGDVGGVVRGNYATWNPIYTIPSNTTTSFTNGNLDFSVTQAEGTGTASAVTTMPLPTTGKWYWEITPTTVATAAATRTQIGVMAQNTISYAMGNIGAGNFAYTAEGGSNSKVNNNVFASYGNSYTANDVISVAVDLDNGAIYFAKNGTWQNSGVPTSGSSKTGAAYTTLTGTSNYFPAVGYWGTYVANFGQRPFAYTAPSGFKALCTQNLPTPTIGATSTTQANDYFDVKTWSGNSSTQSIALEFAPGLIWNKSRSDAAGHSWWDVLRGTGAQISSNQTDAETTGYNAITSFSNNAISLGVDNTGTYNGRTNETGRTYVGWVWNAGSSTVTNTSGTISSQVRANTTSGFSIVTYTGTGVNATVGHGLGVAPSMIIAKRRSATQNWGVWHTSLSGTQTLYLDLTQSVTTAVWNGTPTSTVFNITTDGVVNTNGSTYVAYCFAAVAGYSAFGSYTGNGSSDGPFVYTGFRPRWILTKKSNATENWYVMDTARSTYNVVSAWLCPDLSIAEATSQTPLDIVSNGFKFRTTNTAWNNNGDTYIYAAFAESPFKFALAR